MKSKKLRILIPVIILVVVAIGFIAGNSGIGNLSAFGWKDISILCPVGALTSMLAAKIMMPRALIALIIAIVLILLFGRAFCSWICPVPIVEKTRNLFTKPKSTDADAQSKTEVAKAEVEAVDVEYDFELSEEEKEMLSASCGCHAKRHGALDARHIVLGGGLLSAAIFGFPVFCLICPVGLSFASIFLVVRAFGFGDVSLLLVLVPLFLVLEVVVFRRWCHTFCPISAFMSLIGFGNRTFRPKIDNEKCLESSRGVSCGRCGIVCRESIDPRHPKRGNGMNECTRCRACIDVCPAHAISMPFVSKKSKGAAPSAGSENSRAAD